VTGENAADKKQTGNSAGHVFAPDFTIILLLTRQKDGMKIIKIILLKNNTINTKTNYANHSNFTTTNNTK